MPSSSRHMAEELQAVLHEQHRLDEQIATFQQQMSQLDHWLKAHDPATLDYQDELPLVKWSEETFEVYYTQKKGKEA